MKKPIMTFLIGLFIPGIIAAQGIAPSTAKRPVTDEFYGAKVTEDYRWLENFDDPEVKSWNALQNAYSRHYLDSLLSRPYLERRLIDINSSISPNYYSLQYISNRLFARKSQPPREQSFLVVMNSPDDLSSEKIVVDPNVIDPSGSTTIDFYAPSLNGQYIAVSLSEHGSELGTVHVYRVDDGTETGDIVPRVNGPTAGGSVAWNHDGSGFYYSRYPHKGERPDEDLDFYQQVYYHQLGKSSDSDIYIIGKEFPKIAEIELKSSADGKYVLAIVSNGDGGEFAHFLMDPACVWTQITQFSDQISGAEFGLDGSLYLLSHLDASRGKILRLHLDNPKLADAQTVIPASNAVIEGFEPGLTRIYVRDLVDGSAQIRIFDLQGNYQGTVPVQPMSSVWTVLHTSNDQILYYSESYTDPECWYRYNPTDNSIVPTALKVKPPVEFGDVEVSRVFAISKDGTRVPMAIIMKRGTVLDGQNPTLLKGYGGYGNSTTPSFNSNLRIWLDGGGIIAEASIRGGGEYGEDWHKAGYLTKKQNVFDDFIACAEYLIGARYTSPAKLAIEGGSNGGLLMGAALVQRPELFRAVVSHVGMYDMLRAELEPNGEFNVTEFGTVKDPEQFKALYAYSPYHHVENGKAYPAILMLTGDHDGRVDPSNSRKMTARLQEASASGLPVLLRTSSAVGHGIGSSLSQRISAQADVYAFLFELLGIRMFEKAEPPQ